MHYEKMEKPRYRILWRSFMYEGYIIQAVNYSGDSFMMASKCLQTTKMTKLRYAPKNSYKQS